MALLALDVSLDDNTRQSDARVYLDLSEDRAHVETGQRAATRRVAPRPGRSSGPRHQLRALRSVPVRISQPNDRRTVMKYSSESSTAIGAKVGFTAGCCRPNDPGISRMTAAGLADASLRSRRIVTQSGLTDTRA